VKDLVTFIEAGKRGVLRGPDDAPDIDDEVV